MAFEGTKQQVIDLLPTAVKSRPEYQTIVEASESQVILQVIEGLFDEGALNSPTYFHIRSILFKNDEQESPDLSLSDDLAHAE